MVDIELWWPESIACLSLVIFCRGRWKNRNSLCKMCKTLRLYSNLGTPRKSTSRICNSISLWSGHWCLLRVIVVDVDMFDKCESWASKVATTTPKNRWFWISNILLSSKRDVGAPGMLDCERETQETKGIPWKKMKPRAWWSPTKVKHQGRFDWDVRECQYP